MSGSTLSRIRRRGALSFALLIGFSCASHAAIETQTLTATQRQLLEGTLQRELAPLIKGKRVYEGQTRDIPLKISVSADRHITLELGAEAGPHAEEELEDFHTDLFHQAMYYADEFGEGSIIDFRYGGMPISFYSTREARSLYCGYPAEPVTHPLQVKIVDADNVETGWVPYTVNCPAASAGHHAPSTNGGISLHPPYFTRSTLAPMG
jgi:hypothetical protein